MVENNSSMTNNSKCLEESFLSRNRLGLSCLLGALVIGFVWYVFIGHDIQMSIDGGNKSTMNWIDSQTECRWLKQYDLDLGVHNKWFKDSTDNELIKKMEELKC